MQTGENEQSLRKIIDLTRMLSIVLLLLHFYISCYAVFCQYGYHTKITDKILLHLQSAKFISHHHLSKLLIMVLLIISLFGARGRKDEKMHSKQAIVFIATGLLFYFLSSFILFLNADIAAIGFIYIITTSIGFLMILTGGTWLSRLLQLKWQHDIFNKENETFPQEERLLNNEYSINLPAVYHLRGKIRKSWINIINPFRGLLIIGSPGAGKSYFIIQHIIKQHIEKGFSMFVYDFKFDDLTKIVYNAYLKYYKTYTVQPKFYIISFDELQYSHRCNPLDPSAMFDITDAIESARTIMLGLNREWIKKQGDFFVESPINFITAIIWFLKKYKNGSCCTLPHVIELMQTQYDKLFSILRTEPEIEAFINPFVSAYINDVMEQLEGQMGAAKITMAKLASPQLYYVLTGNDFTLDINNSKEPKIICVGNNPQKQQVYGAVLSLYIARLIKIINRKGGNPSSLIFDEFPTIYFNGIDNLMATARSNKIATTLAVQDYSQLKKDYGRDQAEVIMNIAGNVISGQVTGDTAKQLSERFGKIMQDRESVSINSNDTSVSKSKQLEMAIPASVIASLSSGEFVGIVADNPEQKIALKAFHNEIVNDHKALQAEQKKYIPLPVIKEVSTQAVHDNYLQVKKDIQNIIETEIERIMNTPELESLLIRKNEN
ncbi:type IV secretory system conjugative DNA transfer [mine drainage metagenome]|uniref:Type IV secretory system conjugative DNA transfer n=1 Tax=mine drainage metagenome TaxID=410659 RepID=A0A1J5RE46_9ZZZZ